MAGWFSIRVVRFCAECDAALPPDAAYCIACGTPQTAFTGVTRRLWDVPAGSAWYSLKWSLKALTASTLIWAIIQAATPVTPVFENITLCLGT